MLIVYKETQCAAAGHKHCRVIGKPADVWGASDPDVILFRDHIQGRAAPLRPIAPPAQATGLPTLDARILAPVMTQLDQLGATRLPVLICGPVGTGKQVAARYLAQKRHGASADPNQLICAGLSVDALDQALLADAKSTGRAKTAPPQSVIFVGVAALPPTTQTRLIQHLDAAQRDPRLPGIIAITRLAPHALRSCPGFDTGLFLRLAASPIALQPLAAPRADIGVMAQLCLDQMTLRCNAKPVTLSAPAIAEIVKTDLPGNLVELDHWLLATVLSGQDITPTTLRAARRGSGQDGTLRADLHDTGLADWIGGRLAGDGLDLNAVEHQILTAAVDQARGTLTAAARLVRLSRPQLAYRMDRARKDGA